MASQIKQPSHLQEHTKWRLTNKRLILPVILLALLMVTNTRAITISVLSDAFWQVATYVAATLAIYHAISSRLSNTNKLTGLLNRSTYFQVLFSASMGALPGCGGAIVVITQYVKGRLSFGSIVAVLTATMGDAAFLLLAAQPKTGLLVISVGFVVGLLSGWIVDAIHGEHFMRPAIKDAPIPSCANKNEAHQPPLRLQGHFWRWMLLPASVIAIMGSFQVNIDQFFHLEAGTINIIGAAAAIVSILLWAISRDITDYESAVSEDPKEQTNTLFQRVAQDTNFVTSWVICAFLLFELTMYWTGINLASAFTEWSAYIPLMGVVIGLLPGCGPQILVTSLYISGAVPLSAQLGNSISNDGDALFPAIVLAPKAALMATIYSSIPAVIVAYGYYYLFE
ncbi:MAG: putative manganese transporter [Photobacterium frigidiphilum]|uniref:putative manganese transporter n=1 Tax=Photobacterium frigidiphilum TaxID=264736 RepID=UPI003001F77A